MQPDTWPGSPTPPTEAKDRPSYWLLAGAIFTAVGLILGAVCVLLVALDNDFRSTAVRATGTVVGYDTRESTHRNDDDRTRRTVSYAPVVRFSTADGRTIEFTSGIAKSSKPVTGSQVDVLYDPDDPQHAKIDDAVGRLLAPVITGGLGGIFLLIGLLLLGLHVRSGRRRA